MKRQRKSPLSFVLIEEKPIWQLCSVFMMTGRGFHVRTHARVGIVAGSWPDVGTVVAPRASFNYLSCYYFVPRLAETLRGGCTAKLVNNREFDLLYDFLQAGTSRSWTRFLWNLHPGSRRECMGDTEATPCAEGRPGRGTGGPEGSEGVL